MIESAEKRASRIISETRDYQTLDSVRAEKVTSRSPKRNVRSSQLRNSHLESNVRHTNLGLSGNYRSETNIGTGTKEGDLLTDAHARICLMAMENERISNKNLRLEEDLNEKKRELEIYKGRCDNLEKSRQFDAVNEERLIHLRHERDKLDALLRDANKEVDILKNSFLNMKCKVLTCRH